MEKDVVVELLIKQRTIGLTIDEKKKLETLLSISCISKEAYELMADAVLNKK